ncbi:MAG TPA: hypothetical protein PKM56_11080 [Candidatus Rifleibacterium sp.]|nr:hypothetical protein [Candidatus Rifleibacterium sp.]
MSVLYSLISSQEYAEVFTLILLALFCLAYGWFIWTTAVKLGTKMSNFELVQLAAMGSVVFLCGVTILGKIISPEGSDMILDALGLDTVLYYLTTRFQVIALTILRGLM